MRHSEARHQSAKSTIGTRASGVFVAGALLAAVAALGLGGCSSTFAVHGARMDDQDVSQITTGMTQDQVRQALGTPTTTTSAGRGNAFYYISSKTKQTAFFKPQEIDRKVVAVYFSQVGAVDRVANYGMKDGKVFDFVSRTTPSANTNDQSLVQQLFRNIGQRQIFGG